MAPRVQWDEGTGVVSTPAPAALQWLHSQGKRTAARNLRVSEPLRFEASRLLHSWAVLNLMPLAGTGSHDPSLLPRSGNGTEGRQGFASLVPPSPWSQKQRTGFPRGKLGSAA